MPRKKNDLVSRAERVANAWKSYHPQKAFFGLTLDAFMEAFKPCREARRELKGMASRRRLLQYQRRTSDQAFKPLLAGVVYSVRGDPDVGEDDPMYSAMGYVSRLRRRKPGRKRKARAAAERPTTRRRA